MNYSARATLAFYDQNEGAVFLETTGGPDDLWGQLAFFAGYTFKQMSNLGRSETAGGLAVLLRLVTPETLASIGGDKLGMRLVDFRKGGGPKSFESSIHVGANLYTQVDIRPRGFGFLARGVGYYAPTSVVLLMRYLSERHLLDEEFQEALSTTAQNVGEAYLTSGAPGSTLSQWTVAVSCHATMGNTRLRSFTTAVG